MLADPRRTKCLANTRTLAFTPYPYPYPYLCISCVSEPTKQLSSRPFRFTTTSLSDPFYHSCSRLSAPTTGLATSNTCVTSSTLYGTSEHFAVRSLPSFFPFFLFFYCLRSLWPSLSLSRDIQKGYRPGVPFHPPITKLSKKLDFSCSNSSPQFNLKLELELLP